MVVSPTFYVILTTFFSLLFLVLAILLEKRKKPILTFLGKKVPLLVKIPWDTVITLLALGWGILFLIRFIDYVPFLKAIHTKFSVWWVEYKMLIPGLFFLLLFLLAVFVVERYTHPIRLFLKEKFLLLRKIPWDNVIKGLAVAGFILFSRKLIYPVSFFGVIQTTSSIWWVDLKILIFLSYLLLLFLFGCVLIAAALGVINMPQPRDPETSPLGGLFIIFFVGAVFSLGLLKGITIEKGFTLIFFAPLLFLKMLCSGKYLGFFTGFLLGYFVLNRYKKLKPEITRNNRKYLIVPGLILLVFLISNFFIFSGDWQERFRSKIHSAKSDAAILELLDAANSIDNSSAKSDALKKIVVQGVVPWKKETCQQMIKAAMTIKSFKESSSIIKELALTAAKTGDIARAISVAENIPVKEIRNNVLKELREKIGEK